MWENCKIIFIIIIYIFLFNESILSENYDYVLIKKILPTGKIKKQEKLRFKWGVALSGGGARGFAHLGVLKAMYEEEMKPDKITGTSMGAVIGGFVSAGYEIEEIMNILHEVDFKKVFSNYPNRGDILFNEKYYQDNFMAKIAIKNKKIHLPESIFSGYEIQKLFFRYLSTISTVNKYYDFENLYYPIKFISADIINGEGYIWNQGDLGIAVRSSMNIPGVFPPIKIGKHQLVDGGIYKNLPVEELNKMGVDFSLGVNIGSKPLKNVENIVDTFRQITTIFINKEVEKSKEKASFNFDIQLNNYNAADFEKYNEIYTLGYNYAKKNIKKLKMEIDKNRAKYYVQNILINDSKININKELTQKEIYREINNITGQNVWSYRGKLQGNNIEIKNIKKVDKVIIKSPDESISFETYSINNAKRLLNKIQKLERKKGYFGTIINNYEYKSSVLFINTHNLKVDKIKIRNNKYYSERFIKKYFKRKGGLYFDDKLMKSMDRLYGTGNFDQVIPYFNKKNEKVILNLYIKEKEKQLLSFTGNYETDKGFKIYSKFVNRDLIGWNEAIIHELFLDKDRHTRLSFESSFFLDLPLKFSTGFGYKEESDYPLVNYREIGYYGFTGFNYTNYLFSSGIFLNYRGFNSLFQGYNKYFYISADFNLDMLNDGNLPTTGYKFDLFYEKSLNNLDYDKYSLYNEIYLNVLEKFTFYAKTFYGTTVGDDSTFNNLIYKPNFYDNNASSYYEEIFDLKVGCKYLGIRNIIIPFSYVGYITTKGFEKGDSYLSFGIERKIPILKYFKWEFMFDENYGKMKFKIGANF